MNERSAVSGSDALIGPPNDRTLMLEEGEAGLNFLSVQRGRSHSRVLSLQTEKSAGDRPWPRCSEIWDIEAIGDVIDPALRQAYSQFLELAGVEVAQQGLPGLPIDHDLLRPILQRALGRSHEGGPVPIGKGGKQWEYARANDDLEIAHSQAIKQISQILARRRPRIPFL